VVSLARQLGTPGNPPWHHSDEKTTWTDG